MFNGISTGIGYLMPKISSQKDSSSKVGDQKAPFSIADVGEGASPFPGLLHFTFDTYFIFPSVTQGGIKFHFKVFVMTRPGIKPRSSRPLANTLPTKPVLSNS